jgi:alginate O-acetyltransferase complex protein AlgI
MITLLHTRRFAFPRHLAAFLPLMALPVLAACLAQAMPAWVQMWVVAVSIYAGFKWATFALCKAARDASVARSLGYLLLWTGMDADAFFASRQHASRPRWTELAWASVQTAFGLWLLIWFAPRLMAWPLVSGWMAMTGIVSVLHFGVSHFASLAWRSRGVNAVHIMDKPVLAQSLADFWGRRWNLAFRELMHQFVFRPLAPQLGSARAMLVVFFVSGLIHDAVISFAARGGYGLPTIYFLIQGLALLFERSPLGRRMGLGGGLRGWLFAAAVIVMPAGLLFHRPFIEHVVLPMVQAIPTVMP